MELSSLQHLDDNISFGWISSSSVSLDDDVRHSLGSPGSSFIDMYPAEFSYIDMYPADAEHFTERWTTAVTSEFDFDRPVVADGATASPMLLVSASRIFRGGLLLPCEPGSALQDHGDGVDAVQSAVQEHGDVDGVDAVHSAVHEHGDGVDGVPNVSQWSDSLSSMFDSARITASSCSGAMSDAGSKLAWRQRLVCAGGSSSSSSTWKMLSNYLRFLVPLYRKVRALRPRTRVGAPAASSLTRESTSSAIKWGHGNSDAAIDDAILYFKKSSGQAV